MPRQAPPPPLPPPPVGPHTHTSHLTLLTPWHKKKKFQEFQRAFVACFDVRGARWQTFSRRRRRKIMDSPHVQYILLYTPTTTTLERRCRFVPIEGGKGGREPGGGGGGKRSTISLSMSRPFSRQAKILLSLPWICRLLGPLLQRCHCRILKTTTKGQQIFAH